MKSMLISLKTSCRPRVGEMVCPPPTAVRLAADLRPSAGGSAARTWLSCRQPAVSIAYGSCALRLTNSAVGFFEMLASTRSNSLT